MRYSAILIPTLKESPVEARVVSHQLMLRAGLIRQLSSGIYTWLPLGLRVLRRVEQIVRSEMDRAGAQEVLMPAVQPAELWQESGRWGHYGKELLRLTDRHERAFCFGPTHEEVITDLVRREIRSWRQLPVNFYQIQTKFRDEIRPRFGVMRGREFLMKDAYSFDMDEAGLEQSYQQMFQAYQRIFSRCGLRFRAVEADTGAIGGASSHEFHVLASSGEDTIASCTNCPYAANVEKATAALPAAPSENDEPMQPLTEVETPGQTSIDAVSQFLAVPAQRLIKSLVVVDEAGGSHLLLLRGNDELNEVKMRLLLGNGAILPGAEQVVQQTGLPVGSLGPLHTTLPVTADLALHGGRNMVCGANRKDYHWTGVNWDRDLVVAQFADLRTVVTGDSCPRCASGTLVLDRGIEVGHVFKLGLKYSQALDATVLDANGEAHHPIMGCYGIGVSRIVAAAIEQHHDDKGIIWPVSLAPFAVILVQINAKEEEATVIAQQLYQTLQQQGVEVLWDDRDERAGVKFKDADLLGIPLQVVIGGRSLKEGMVELRQRRIGEVLSIAPDQVAATVTRLLDQLGREESAL
ncbi:MAG: proline--tRNA ligase [Magnetococcales bacterium]|nr:proline--tRNA ligase [Magnetococcales bacterium]